MAEQAPRQLTTRSKARKRALDILFEADLIGNDVIAVLDSHTLRAEPPVRPFTADLVRGVAEHREAIDSVIGASLAEGWSVSRMPRVDRNLARIAVFEILYTELPDEVAVSECVALGQDLSTDDSPGFLNGVLRTVVEQHIAGKLD